MRGRVAKKIRIRSENDPGRFPLVLRKRYLLFLMHDARGYGVSNCGNCGLLAQSSAVLWDLSNALDGGK